MNEKQSLKYSLVRVKIERNTTMSEHYKDTFGECDNCQLESRLFGGICEDCDSEYFAEFFSPTGAGD